jgi:hypothetical protein
VLKESGFECSVKWHNAADEENPLVIRRKAPHNQRIEQTPFGHCSTTALLGNYRHEEVNFEGSKGVRLAY